MKNKKGFTLVELLCVMVLLTFILLISYPNFNKLTSLVSDNYDANVKTLAKAAAKVYVSNNKEEVDTYLNSNPKYCVPLGKLVAYEYLDPNIKDLSKNELNMKRCVNVTKEEVNSKTKYNYELSKTDVIGDDVDYIPPTLILKKKVGKTLNCSLFMKTTKDLFNSNCEVIANDNVSTNVQVNVEEKTNANSIILIFTAQDEAGNKAIPLKVKLTTN